MARYHKGQFSGLSGSLAANLTSNAGNLTELDDDEVVLLLRLIDALGLHLLFVVASGLCVPSGGAGGLVDVRDDAVVSSPSEVRNNDTCDDIIMSLWHR